MHPEEFKEAAIKSPLVEFIHSSLDLEEVKYIQMKYGFVLKFNYYYNQLDVIIFMSFYYFAFLLVVVYWFPYRSCLFIMYLTNRFL